MSQEKKTRRLSKVWAGFFGLLALLAAEFFLRLFGVAAPGLPARLAFGFPKSFIREGGLYITNPAAPFLMKQSFSAKKAKNTTRIFILGGSQAMGFPLEGAYGPAELLQAALSALGPERNYEVINACGFGYGSYEVERVAEEVLAYEPDFVIVMTGNNEFLERRFEAEDGVEEPAFVKALWRIRLFRVLKAAREQLKGEAEMRMQKPHKVNKRERELVLGSFKRTLARLVEECRAAGVRLLVAVPPVNLSDFRPYGPSEIPEERRKEIDRHLKSGASGLALAKLAQEYPRFSEDAWFYFEKAYALKVSHLIRHYARKARRERNLAKTMMDYFKKARDLDSWPVRITSPLEQAAREAASSDGVILADVARSFEEQYLLSGGPGDQVFFDHCHLRPRGQALLAETLLDALIRAGAISPGPAWKKQAEEVWKRMEKGLGEEKKAEAYYKTAYETGMNMDRWFRGKRLAAEALKLNPGHVKARRLLAILKEKSAGRFEFTGD